MERHEELRETARRWRAHGEAPPDPPDALPCVEALEAALALDDALDLLAGARRQAARHRKVLKWIREEGRTGKASWEVYVVVRAALKED